MEPKSPKVGARIRYTTRTARRGWLETETREGVVTCVWTNGWDGPHINIDDGGHCIPALGDTFEIVRAPDVAPTPRNG